MEVLEAAVQGIAKRQGARGATVQTSTLLAVDDELAALVSEILTTYNNRLAHKTGVFQENENSYPFSRLVREFEEGQGTFLEFTGAAAEHLRVKIDALTFATGGYLFFAKYFVGGKNFLLVVKLNEAQGRVFDLGRGRVVATAHLSTDKLQQAARVNLSGHSDGEGNYISLVSKRVGEDTSEYFVEFIGCSIAQTGRQETSKLVTVVDDYCAALGLDEDSEGVLRTAVFSHVQSRLKQDLPVSLEALANVISPHDPARFLAFLNEHAEKPSDEFLPTDRELRRLVKVYVSVPGLRMTLTRQFIDQHHARVDGGSLIIENVPEKVAKAFE